MFGAVSRACVVACVALFAILYVAQTGASAARGYEVSDLERRIQTLSQETGSLDVQIATHRSMESIQTRLASLGMVPVTDVAYLSAVGTAVARR